MEKVSNRRIDGNIRSFVIRPKRTKRRAEAKRWEGAVGNLRICGKAAIPSRFSQVIGWGSCSVASRTSTAFAARRYLARQSGMPRRQCIDPLLVERSTLSHRPDSTTYEGFTFELGNQSIGRDVMLHMNGTLGARQSAHVPPCPIADAGLDHSHLLILAFDGSCLPMSSVHTRTIASTARPSQSRTRSVASFPPWRSQPLHNRRDRSTRPLECRHLASALEHVQDDGDGGCRDEIGRLGRGRETRSEEEAGGSAGHGGWNEAARDTRAGRTTS